MFFPDSLDNKTFRLFVERTVTQIKANNNLSSSEKELATIINEHPELELLLDDGPIDIKEEFPDDEYNPFLLLAALWEVEKQLLKNSPKGLNDILQSLQKQHVSKNETRSKLSIMYLDFYNRHNLGEKVTAEDYVAEAINIANNPLYFENKFLLDVPDTFDSDYDYSNNFYASSLEKSFAHYQAKMYKEVGAIDLNPSAKLTTCFNKLPSEWVNATAIFWKRPAQKLKRDKIADITSFLLSPQNQDIIIKNLQSDEKELLLVFLQNDGFLRYGQLTKQFGEEDTGYWWTQSPPKSLIGRLRYKGILFMGIAPFKSRKYKIGLIPKDLLPVFVSVL